METINSKTITLAEDKFYYLDNEQLMLEVMKLQQRQPEIFAMALNLIKLCKNKDSPPCLWMLILILDDCFLTENEMIGEITDASTEAKVVWLQNEMQNAIDKNGNIDIFKIALMTKQDTLLFYFTRMLAKYEDEVKIISNNENIQFMLALLLFCFLYIDEANKTTR